MHPLSRLLLATAALAAVGVAQSTLVAPNGYATAEGGTNNAYPWNRGTSPMRIQFIYDSSHFTSQGVVSPIIISRLRFRADAAATTVTWAGGQWSTAVIDMSTAAVDYLTPSATFAANHGPNLTNVVNGPIVVQGGAGNGAGIPGPWYIDIPLATNFLYDPLSGSDLVMDIQVDGVNWTGTSRAADHVSTGSPAPFGSRIYSTASATATTGTVGTNYAAVCEFTYTPAAGLYAGFTASATRGASPLTVNFTDRSFSSDPLGVLTWAWDFDGDNVVDSTQQNPTWVYNNCGSYTVSLTVNDASHAPSTLTRPAYVVTDTVTASFTYNVIGPATVTFTDTTTPTPTSWAWDFDGDSIIDSTAQNPAFVYPSTTTLYSVSLTANRLCGPNSTVVRQLMASPSLTTQLPANNGGSSGWVAMYDINVTNPQGINLTAFDSISSTAAATPFTINLYVVPGTYVGNDASITPWRMVGTASGTTAAPNTPSNAVLAQAVYLAPGSYGLGLHYTGLSPRYENATATNISYSNGDIALSLGGVRSTLFAGGSWFPARSWSGTVYYDKMGVGNLAGVGFFAPGCASSLGITTQVPTSRPVIGQSLSINLNNLPSSFAIMLLGFSRTNSLLGPLPVDLTPFGAPGCTGRVSPDANGLAFGAANAATWTLGLPNNGALLGLPLYSQAFVIDPALNALGGAMSDAAALLIGN